MNEVTAAVAGELPLPDNSARGPEPNVDRSENNDKTDSIAREVSTDDDDPPDEPSIPCMPCITKALSDGKPRPSIATTTAFLAAF
ncbi:hypothetical protein CEP53_008155 [Fusarium sp. AF-6]|nr:hypothetical protein CEP53_008155 [Fusarium sp. AF-6]